MSYLILCVKNGRSRQLGRALWWRPNSNGYTTDVDAAGRYTEEECSNICRPGENIAVPEGEAIDYSVPVVFEYTQWEDDEFKRRWNQSLKDDTGL